MGFPVRRRGNRPGSGQQVNQPAPEHGPEESTGKAAAKEARGSIPSRTNIGQFVITLDGAQICSRFATSTDRDACSTPSPARTCTCVSEMLAASPKQLRGMCTARGANGLFAQSSSTPAASASNCLACDSEHFGEWGWGSQKRLPTSRVGKLFNHLTRRCGQDATFSNLVENRPTGSACCGYTLRRRTTTFLNREATKRPVSL